MGDIILPVTAKNATHVFHLFVIRTKYRDALQNHLTDKGIGTLKHYPIPPHLQAAYRDLGYKQGDLPIAEEIAETCLSLPIWPGMEKEEIEYISSIISLYFKK